MKEEEFRRLYDVPEGAHITYIDLDAQKETPMNTAGWTDDQIRGKSLQEIDAQITSAEAGLTSLRETVRAEEDRLAGLRLVRDRKVVLGG